MHDSFSIFGRGGGTEIIEALISIFHYHFVQICTPEDSCRYGRVSELYVYDKFNRVTAKRVEAGDICAVCGITDIQVKVEDFR